MIFLGGEQQDLLCPHLIWGGGTANDTQFAHIKERLNEALNQETLNAVPFLSFFKVIIF